MADAPAPVKRTQEIEEASNLYLVHPISRVLVTFFARLGVHPNAVSVLGLLFGGAAALAYYRYGQWTMSLTGFLLMIGWHIMDGADGQLARLTGKTSEIGKVLDGLCDHGTFIMVYYSLALALTPAMGAWIWILAGLAGLSHIAQASAYEFQRQSYDFWVHGKQSARIIPLDEFRRQMDGKGGLARLFARFNLLYLKIQRQFAAIDDGLQTRLAAALDDPDEEDGRIREAYRSVNLRAVKRWSILSSNNRTLAIFLSCLAGSPVYFFVFEIVFLNAALVFLTRMQRRRNLALSLHLSKPVDEVR